MDFVFYDLETTGISPEFDQPLQFAAIWTDENFVEKDRVNIRCRLAPHILPSPQALVVTRVTPDQLTDPNLPSLFEFSQQVAEFTERWAPAIWVGYNTMKFDEEVLRQTFYQNLSPNIYATQSNGNTRFDILPAVYAAYGREPDLLVWPTDDTGRRSFKLDRLAPANGFNAHNSHDALGDVEATIHIARLISTRRPALWSELLDNAHKARVQAKLESFRPYELVTRFGGGEPRSYVGCFCGYSQGNSAQAAFFDLDTADPSDFLESSDDAIFAAVDATPKIIRGVSTNKAPALLEHAAPSAEHLRRAAVIANATEFRQRVGAAMAARFVEDPDVPPKPVERQIYGEFYSNADKQLLQEFKHATWSRRQEIVLSLRDSRLQQLGRRLVAFYSPELLNAKEAELFKSYLREKWSAPDVPETEWMTFEKGEVALRDLRAAGAAEPNELDAIAAFLWARCARDA
ncbi:exonuclease domain-containing protein [Lacimonas salitolerans]|uniref:Exonuclease domain-containing protein n=1 Tax=Lacimonas salitolerans TaxID=1323750 RepID=A0ABW4EHB5_9RHOB